ncbi:MAG: aromatic-ring-hydroxylating dioxygenase subunit beta [Burkholderiaceae bacterium]
MSKKKHEARKDVEQAVSGQVVIESVDRSPARRPWRRTPRGGVGGSRPTSTCRSRHRRPRSAARVETLLFRQAALLDAKDWQGFIDGFTDDGLYWMPVHPGQQTWEGQPAIFIEDKLLMEVRMGRLQHPNAWSQAPMWGTSHLVGNVIIEASGPDEIKVASRFQMMELRRDQVRHFGGSYRHTLRRAGGHCASRYSGST